jgi:hypothetical protein
LRLRAAPRAFSHTRTRTGFFYFAIDSILLENVFQFWVSIVIHTIITMFVAWFHFEEELGSFVNDFTVYVLGVVVVLEFVYLGLSPFVQKAFGWRLYKRIGTKAAMQEMYRTASFFFSLLKLDLFLGILLVCLASFFLFSKTSQIVLNAVAMALTVAWALSGWSAVYNETRSCIFLFYAFALLQPAYICYKLYELHFHANDYPDVTLPQFAISGSLSLIVRALLLVWAHFAHLNFGKGLREKAFFKNDVDESTLAEVREYARPLCPCAEDTAVAEEAKSAGQLQPRV